MTFSPKSFGENRENLSREYLISLKVRNFLYAGLLRVIVLFTSFFYVLHCLLCYVRTAWRSFSLHLYFTASDLICQQRDRTQLAHAHILRLTLNLTDSHLAVVATSNQVQETNNKSTCCIKQKQKISHLICQYFMICTLKFRNILYKNKEAYANVNILEVYLSFTMYAEVSIPDFC